MNRHPVSVTSGQDSGEVDSAVRRREFEAAHPEVTIIPPATASGRWRAIVPLPQVPREPDGTMIGAWMLDDLMDQLHEIYPP